jgi:sn-glycerol 3-phosphate transport system permease protein
MQTLLNVGGSITFGPLMSAAIIASILPPIVFIAMQKPFMSGFVISQDK